MLYSRVVVMVVTVTVAVAWWQGHYMRGNVDGAVAAVVIVAVAAKTGCVVVQWISVEWWLK